ncbi:apolipoprotein N-acyltransferase [Pasteurellaceae bacterium RH1A]|nr:apolipoprotein N-acyltransferase [Pasteurellaceae bacterium RH1A]
MEQKKTIFLTACLAFVLGAIGIFAYSPYDLWPLAFLSAGGLLWAAQQGSLKTALGAVFAWSIGYFGIGVNWVHVSMIQFGGVPELVSYLAVLLLAAYLALYNLLFTYLAHRFRLTNPLALAGLFTFTEYLRGWVFTGFPWLQFGYSQIDSPFFGLAPLLGVEGLTFFVVATSGLFLASFRKFQPACLVGLASLVALAFGSQFLNFIEEDKASQPTTISLVQGNIEQKMKWDPAFFDHTIRTYQGLISPLLGKSDIIILPESAIPALEVQIEPLLHQLQAAGEKSGSELIIGTLHRDQADRLYNSALVVGNSQNPYSLYQSSRYNKHHLVPFGEYVPFGSVLNWMREVFILPVNLSQGSFIQKPLVAQNQAFNMAICYEIIFGNQVQANQKAHQADFLLTISNDAWFGSSSGPWQHFQMARMRALELGKPLVRATNTGITAFVDHRGKVLAQAPQFEATSLTYKLTKTNGQTPFGQFGHWLIYGLSLVALLIGFRKRK